MFVPVVLEWTKGCLFCYSVMYYDLVHTRTLIHVHVMNKVIIHCMCMPVICDNLIAFNVSEYICFRLNFF